ncbi:hypothetical protein QAD02_002354 [Eretmocerus hayati]|uniref:Uncharacterized protein n=1 Tax=Eretmocerus hayati TaxID=131215 RepID=A0ACC2NIN5_9HYME|nr:hypothetical protein QAD02_002354 [Eretmocerus hayati]
MFPCQTCLRESERIDQYNKHQLEHRADHEMKFACRYSNCNFISPTYLGFKQHLLRDHKYADEGHFKCHYKGCEFICRNVDILKRHYNEHIQETSVGIICPFCPSTDQKFNSKGSYNVHVTKFHNDLYESHSYSPPDNISEQLDISSELPPRELMVPDVSQSNHLPEMETDSSTDSLHQNTDGPEKSNETNFVHAPIERNESGCSEIIQNPHLDDDHSASEFPPEVIQTETRVSAPYQSTSEMIIRNPQSAMIAPRNKRKMNSETTTRSTKEICSNASLADRRREVIFATKSKRKNCSEMTALHAKKFRTEPPLSTNNIANENIKNDTIKQYGRSLISLTLESHATEPVIQTMIDNNYQVFESCRNHFFDSISSFELADRDKRCILDGFKKSFTPMTEMFDPNSGCFRSTFRRNQFYDTNFDFVPPQRIFICNPNGEITDFSYSYVPIFETLRVMLKNEDIRQYCENSNVKSNNKGFFDIKDGNVVKDNEFFQQENIILLGLFQDAFELCSPIGSHKKKHKMLGFYLTILNLAPHLRSKLKNIKLLLLCKETYQKDYGWDEILRILIRDLKRLETEGITIGCGNGEFVNFKGSIVVVFGDNLGSHSIGGFCESFNKCLYICRYCDMTMPEFLQNPLLVRPFRTLGKYDKCVSDVAKTKKLHVKGIKKRSKLDELEHFEVMKPGLSPCVDHDIYEGFAAFDMWLCINHFVKEGYIRIGFLNYRLNDLRLKKGGKIFIPKVSLKTRKTKQSKLIGTASQIKRLINIFPVVVADAMKKRAYFDPVWRMFLALRNVCSLASASAMSRGQVSLFKTYCEEYIKLRVKCFPKVQLRPKHKYLMHYFDLIHHFGPPSKNSTLRFEGKHNYFKQAAEQIQNYKDITQTLAVHHERMQSINDNSCAPFCEPFVSKRYDVNDYDDTVSAKLFEYFGSDFVSQLLVSERITVCGTTYEKDMMLCVDKSKYGNFVTCKISLILVSLDHSDVFFLGNTNEVVKNDDFGIYKFVEYASHEMRCKELSIFSHSNLLSPEPFLQTEIKSVPVLLAKYEPFDPQLWMYVSTCVTGSDST